MSYQFSLPRWNISTTWDKTRWDSKTGNLDSAEYITIHQNSTTGEYSWFRHWQRFFFNLSDSAGARQNVKVGDRFVSVISTKTSKLRPWMWLWITFSCKPSKRTLTWKGTTNMIITVKSTETAKQTTADRRMIKCTWCRETKNTRKTDLRCFTGTSVALSLTLPQTNNFGCEIYKAWKVKKTKTA